MGAKDIKMEPIFSLPYSEFCVAQQLAKWLPAKEGYSIYAPISRQQPGVDLLLGRRRASRTSVASIQVKSSRTYSRLKTTDRTKHQFRYDTFFNNFDCPQEADFFCLVALYPAVDAAQKRELGTWWAPLVLLFTQSEMRRFLLSIRTVSGGRDKMFGFGFNDPERVSQTRGDAQRRFLDFSNHLLPSRVAELKKFVSAQ
jgi:hypothetical protein